METQTEDITLSRESASRPCYENRHLSCHEQGLLTLLRRLSHKKTAVSYSYAALAKLFRKGTESKTTIEPSLKYLIAEGWVEALPKRYKTARGVYRVVGHAEWAAKHPGQCFTDPQESKSELESIDSNPSSEGSELASPDSNLASPDSNLASPDSTKLDYKLNCKLEAAATDPLSVPGLQPSQTNESDTGMDQSRQSGVSVPRLQLPLARVPRTDLVTMVQNRAMVKQRTQELDSKLLTLVEEQPPAIVQSVFSWALEEPYWMERIVGANALRNFIRSFPTIYQQMRADNKKKATANTMKAESVKASTGFVYPRKS